MKSLKFKGSVILVLFILLILLVFYFWSFKSSKEFLWRIEILSKENDELVNVIKEKERKINEYEEVLKSLKAEVNSLKFKPKKYSGNVERLVDEFKKRGF